MIDPAKDSREFKQRVRRTPNIARLEKEEDPQNMTINNAIYYRAFLSSDIVMRMKNAKTEFDVVEDIIRRITNLGAKEVYIDGTELVIAYKNN